MLNRRGFTLVEAGLAATILSILAVVALQRGATAISRARVVRAAAIVAQDLERARSMAAQTRSPVDITCDCAARTLRLTQPVAGGGNAVRQSRPLGVGSDYELTGVTLAPASIRVFPGGMVSGALSVTLTAGPNSRQVTLSSAGQIRIVRP